MATPLYAPRVNNNDDSVRLVKVHVKPGDYVHRAQLVAEVETDKSNFLVESERDGYVLTVDKVLGETITVGSVLLWLGDAADETVPSALLQPAAPATVAAEPTMKAARLLVAHGLSPRDVPASSGRLTVADVEAFLAARNGNASAHGGDVSSPDLAPGERRALTPAERGMLRTVQWQRDEAVPGYIEITHDASRWERLAAQYQQRERLLMSPLLALMAHRLARFAAAHERCNATIVNDTLHMYRVVNLGFTIQTDTTLYLGVIPDAAALTCRDFIDRLGRLQRAAIRHTLTAVDLAGSTISFSSMARWNAVRHIPVLPPHTSLIVAHAGANTLGATYDHRVLTGFDALNALREVAQPGDIV